MTTGDILTKKRIAVLGARSVGKSSLVVQFIENHFVDGYYPTIENTFRKSLKFQGVEYDCDIIDTAGQDEYSILNTKHAIGIHGYVLVFSVASRNSFDMIQIVHDKILDLCGKSVIPCVVVGSKSDLTTRQVSKEEGQKLAEAVQSVYVETSAKNNINVAKVFELCVGEIEKQNPNPRPAQDKGNCAIM